MAPTTRDRITRAAFQLFQTRGYSGTSVEDIAASAGVSRSTYFRHFPTKEDVVFPDHEALVPRVEARLSTATTETWKTALREAVRIVFDFYLGEGEVARARYELTRAVPALRDREIASVFRYQRLFGDHIEAWLEGDEPHKALRAELMASAVVTAHNFVLRSWLRGATTDPDTDFAHAMDLCLTQRPSVTGSHTFIIHTEAADVNDIIDQVRNALEASP